MQLAARYGHLPVVRLLIDAKANIDAVNQDKCEFFAFDNIESNEIFVFLWQQLHGGFFGRV